MKQNETDSNLSGGLFISMAVMKKIVSYVLFLAFGMSVVFNILFIFNIISRELLQAGVIILILVIFIISVMGIIIKNIRKEDSVSINIITPAKELGGLYAFMLIVWASTYFITVIFK